MKGLAACALLTLVVVPQEEAGIDVRILWRGYGQELTSLIGPDMPPYRVQTPRGHVLRVAVQTWKDRAPPVPLPNCDVIGMRPRVDSAAVTLEWGRRRARWILSRSDTVRVVEVVLGDGEVLAVERLHQAVTPCGLNEGAVLMIYRVLVRSEA